MAKRKENPQHEYAVNVTLTREWSGVLQAGSRGEVESMALEFCLRNGSITNPEIVVRKVTGKQGA